MRSATFPPPSGLTSVHGGRLPDAMAMRWKNGVEICLGRGNVANLFFTSAVRLFSRGGYHFPTAEHSDRSSVAAGMPAGFDPKLGAFDDYAFWRPILFL